MIDQVEILGIKINKVDMGEAVEYINSLIKNKKRSLLITPNSEMIFMAQEDPELAAIINQSDLSIPDGVGVVMASKILGDPVPERVAGFDLMKETFDLARGNTYSTYFLGGAPGVVDIACKEVLKEYPGLKISGFHHGFLNDDLRDNVLKEINRLKPDILYVGMGVPLQEKFLNKSLADMDVGLAMAVGGSFDVLAERVKRAPHWIQGLNLEWLYRLIQEPSRIGRMVALPKFVYLVLLEYIKEKINSDSKIHNK